ncbi:outer membrane protein assembly factor BamA [Pedobacter sp. UYP30]|uniref:translocation and assembly module lipoprotein TamL n=1 Tax=Pedobacter sp. UYP30 TaxID=1756400 RepID=UPI003399E4CC
MKPQIRPILFLMACFVWAGCSVTKRVPEGQYLYTGAEVIINPDSAKKIVDEKAVKNDLESKTRPKPNKSVLGIRYKLLLYNIYGKPTKQKGFKHWVSAKLGEPPVLLSEVKLKNNNAVLGSYLISQGYLQGIVTGDTIVKGKKGKAIYTAVTGQRYKLNNITFPSDTGNLTKIIAQNKDKTLLKTGNFYDLDVFKNERERIDNDLKEQGYFYFGPDDIILQVDSTIGNHLANINVRIKNIAPDAAVKPYTIKNIDIYPNYSLRRDSVIRHLKPLEYNDFEIFDDKKTFKPKFFDRLVFFKKNELYNRTDHSQTLNRLVNVGVFQDVRAEFLPIDSSKNDQLDLNIYLTPLKKNSLSFSVLGTNKSNGFVGSEVKVTQTTRNLFHAGEQLDLSLSGGFETQVGGGTQKQNSYSLTAETKLTFPRLIVPFFHFDATNAYIPRTIASLSYQLLNRGSLYSLSAFKGEFGYNFKENKYKEHVFNPISISYVKPNIDSAKRDSLFLANPAFNYTLQKNFLIGSNYNFTFTNQMEDERRNNMYFFGSLETAGNVWGLFTPKDATGQKSLLNVPLAQFVRGEVDFRDYFKINRNLKWANRLNIGYGYAYGNSTSLPFVRQFFAGGSNDIRAFAARSLGPGSFKDTTNSIFADQGGDIKIMLNSELRFPIVSILQGAAFIDAGNIWLRKEDLGEPGKPNTARPGSGFKLKNVFNEMAVGTGLGLRVDAKILVVRLDVAFPIRKPYLPEGQRWVIDNIAFGSSQWRKENLIYNIGIGYPF